MNIASIDIGSNTVLLLIANTSGGKLLPILNKYESPRLGKGLQIGGKILDDRIEHLLQILTQYKKLIDKYNCKHIFATATNAMRIANNSEKIVKAVHEKFGIEINIISGEEEARLSFLGAYSSLPEIEEKVVIDIGGGSTEIIYGNSTEIFFKHSFQTGVVSLTEKYLNTFPYSDNDLVHVQEFLDQTFSSINVKIPKKISTIAVAGTPTTLSCIKQNLNEYDANLVERSFLDENDFSKLYEDLSTMSGIKIKEKFGQVVNGREDVLFSGLLILNHLKSIIDVDIINVSSRGLRYGNIIDYLNSTK